MSGHFWNRSAEVAPAWAWAVRNRRFARAVDWRLDQQVAPLTHPRNNFEGLARFGYAARGVVYLLLAGLALFSGAWGGAENSQGALSTLLVQPFGRILLGAMAVGLVGFSAWRMAQGALNADHREHTVKNTLTRIGKVVSGVAYLSLGLFAAGMALGVTGGNRGSDSEEGWTAMLMSLPFGPFIVGAIGVVIVGGAFGQIWKAISGAYRKRLDLPHDREKLLVPLCSFGIAARGVVFAIIGGFLLYAAVTFRPEKAGSIGEALDWVRSLPFGGILYVVAALGLFAFACGCVVFALYRRVDAPDTESVSQAARSLRQKAKLQN